MPTGADADPNAQRSCH
ncbi:hypothetical protein PIIN_11611 [Serendipita indica DSM 11827]|uniref:Uncharacterized protein n=1 Tax=Serendipita indica (strain DSM 11827) TaxID=1109443 RepID=G4U240_SERID|nr:hypothetical protein PIIN_11611 [Serendipita indica DSM 11827]